MNKATTWDLKCLLDGVIVQGNKYSLFTSLDSDGEEEVPQQLSVNSSAVSSYDQSNQDQDVVQEIPSEDLYYPNHGQTNGYFFLSFFFSMQSCIKLQSPLTAKHQFSLTNQGYFVACCEKK